MRILSFKFSILNLVGSIQGVRRQTVAENLGRILIGIDIFLGRIWVIVFFIFFIDNFLLSPVLLAQSSATQTKTVSIGVAVGPSLYVDRALDFGDFFANAGVQTVSLSAANTGKLTINGQLNNTVVVTLTPPDSLVNGNHTLPYVPGAAYNDAADDPSTATVWNPPTGQKSAFGLRANHTTGKGGTGEAYIYIYGSVTVGDVPPGTYSGTYLFAVTY